MNRLFIRLGTPATQGPAAADDELWHIDGLSWVLVDDAGELISQGQGDEAALGRLLERRGPDESTGVVLLVPTEYTMMLELDVPGRSAGQMRRALPFVLEEYVATEIDDMHLAHGPLQRGQPVRCVGVERRLVAQWLTALRPLDMRPIAMVPEAALLPLETDTVTVLFDDQDVVIVSPAQAAVVDRSLLVMAVSAAVTELAVEDCAVNVINGEVPALDRSQIEQHLDRAIAWSEDDTEVPALVYLARRWLAEPDALNLLHGEFAPPREIDPDWLKLRPVAALLGIWFVLAVVLEASTAAWAEFRAGSLTDEIEALYRDYFPRERRVVDPYRQMAQHIGQTEAEGASFAELLGHLGAELGAGGNVVMRSVAFNASRGELSAELTIARFDALDALKAALDARGLAVEIASAEQQDDGIHARLRLGNG